MTIPCLIPAFGVLWGVPLLAEAFPRRGRSVYTRVAET
jgi:hypothetical protein